MAYTPTTWTEGVTTVGPTNLTKLETGLQSAAAVADAATTTAAATLHTVGASGNKITAQAMASGPPSSPSDGDIWIATSVDSSGCTWMFRYNTAETTYKWEFVGGSPLVNNGDPNAVINTKTQVAASGAYYDPTTMALTLARAGDYIVDGDVECDSNGGANGWMQVVPFVGTTTGNGEVNTSQTGLTANFSAHSGYVFRGVSASSTAGIAIGASVLGTYKMRNAFVRILPIRII